MEASKYLLKQHGIYPSNMSKTTIWRSIRNIFWLTKKNKPLVTQSHRKPPKPLTLRSEGHKSQYHSNTPYEIHIYSLTGFDGYKADPDSHPKKKGYATSVLLVEHCNSRNTISYVQANVRNPSFQFSVHRKTAAQRKLKIALLQNSACPSNLQPIRN